MIDSTIFQKALNIPDLYLYTLENNFDSHMLYRQEIRQKLYDYCSKNIPEIKTNEQEKLLDLDKVPNLPGVGISITHCPSVGGFTLSSSHKNIGFDIEESKRIQKEPILRVCTENEVNSAPSIAHLWTAKEASLKSFFRVERPKVISQINIFDWKKKQDNTYLFKYSYCNSSGLTLSGQGASLQENCLNMSICKF